MEIADYYSLARAVNSKKKARSFELAEQTLLNLLVSSAYRFGSFSQCGCVSNVTLDSHDAPDCCIAMARINCSMKMRAVGTIVAFNGNHKTMNMDDFFVF